MNIEIHYFADSRAMQGGSFPLRGRQPLRVAYDFWRQIQAEMHHHAQLEKLIVDGDKDFTEAVLELEKQEVKRIMNDNLPF